MLNAEKKYHESNNLQVVVASKLLKIVKREIDMKRFKTCKLIDIGTGDGRVLSEVYVKSFQPLQVIGIDRRQNAVNLAQKIYGNKQINFELFDIEHGSKEEMQNLISDGPFDFGTSSFCLHYAIDQEKTFWNINKLLKPGGSFYFNYLGDHSHVKVHLELAEIFPDLKKSIDITLPLLTKDLNYMENLPNILNKCGFTIDYLNLDTVQYDFKTVENLIDTISTSIAFLYNLEKDCLSQVMDEYVKINQKLSEECGDNSLIIPLTCVHGLITKT